MTLSTCDNGTIQMPVTSAQIRMARGAFNWTVRDLAEATHAPSQHDYQHRNWKVRRRRSDARGYRRCSEASRGRVHRRERRRPRGAATEAATEERITRSCVLHGSTRGRPGARARGGKNAKSSVPLCFAKRSQLLLTVRFGRPPTSSSLDENGTGVKGVQRFRPIYQGSAHLQPATRLLHPVSKPLRGHSETPKK